MKVLKPLPITDASLVSSNVLEDDAPLWTSGASFDTGDEAMVDHRVYRSVIDGNTGNDPRFDDGTKWLELGFTNRWRAFDGKVNDLTTNTGSIVYEFTFGEFASGVGLLGVGAAEVKVEVEDGVGTPLYSRTIDRTEGSAIIDYWTFFTADISHEDVDEIILDDVQGYPGNIITITLSAVNPTSVVSVGQILLGPAYDLGRTLTGTAIGIRDFSSKGRDPFGNAVIVERAFADTTTFQFYLPTKDARRVRNILAGLRAYPSLYFVSAEAVEFGAQTYGFFQDFEIPLSAGGNSFANLKVEGLA